ncbi:MAG: ferredoxin [Rhodococcus sp. (in: high G+C Gram-positive bacteria)]
MKISIDRPRCEGHGLCEEIAPDLMHLDDDGELILDVDDLPEGSPAIADAGAAVRVCPVAALTLS